MIVPDERCKRFATERGDAILENARKWLKQEWWGLIIAYSLLAGGFFALFAAAPEPFALPAEDVCDAWSVLCRRWFFHLIFALLAASHVALFLDLWQRQKARSAAQQNLRLSAQKVLARARAIRTARGHNRKALEQELWYLGAERDCYQGAIFSCQAADSRHHDANDLLTGILVAHDLTNLPRIISILEDLTRPAPRRIRPE